MAWIDIGVLRASSRDWLFSQPFESNLIMIDNSLTSPNSSTPINFLGLISVCFDFEFFFQTQKLFSTPEKQLFLFDHLNNFDSEKRIAIRNISRSINNFQWSVRCYSWDSVINNNVQLTTDNLNSLNQSLSTSLTANLTGDIAQNIKAQAQFLSSQIDTNIQVQGQSINENINNQLQVFNRNNTQSIVDPKLLTRGVFF